MSIASIKPSDCPADLRFKIMRYAASKKIDWTEAVVCLAREAVSPSASGKSVKSGAASHVR